MRHNRASHQLSVRHVRNFLARGRRSRREFERELRQRGRTESDRLRRGRSSLSTQKGVVTHGQRPAQARPSCH